MTLEIEVRSSGPGPRSTSRGVRPEWVLVLLKWRIAAMREGAPRDGVAVIIRRAP
jgi:hypothetical protein